jgi:hypothetical protein
MAKKLTFRRMLAELAKGHGEVESIMRLLELAKDRGELEIKTSGSWTDEFNRARQSNPGPRTKAFLLARDIRNGSEDSLEQTPREVPQGDSQKELRELASAEALDYIDALVAYVREGAQEDRELVNIETSI